MDMRPKCRMGFLNAVSERTGGFSGKKAVPGAVIAGPVGVATLHTRGCRSLRRFAAILAPAGN